jgi:hypothetical protein
MKCKSLLFGVFAFVASAVPTHAANAELYEGDQRLACEALLCLTVGWGESECQPAIKSFFSIWSWKPSRLFSKRMDFLGLCPSDISRDEQVLIVNFAGRCTGERFERYVSGLGSSVEIEGDNSSHYESCSWNDSSGKWWHSGAQNKTCRGARGSYAERLLYANRQCADFRGVFSLSN